MNVRSPLKVLSLAFVLLIGGRAQAEFPPLDGVGFEPAIELDFDRPLWVGHAGDGTNRLFVVEQAGRIYAVDLDARVREKLLVFDWKDRTRRRHHGRLRLRPDPHHRRS